MLVRALKLYDRDAKLTKEQLRAQAPMVGILLYEDNQYSGRDGRSSRRCLLMPPDKESTSPLCELSSARIKIDHRGIRVRGEEDEWRRKERITYQQVLWCIPLSEGDAAPLPAEPYLLKDEQAAIRAASY